MTEISPAAVNAAQIVATRAYRFARKMPGAAEMVDSTWAVFRQRAVWADRMPHGTPVEEQARAAELVKIAREAEAEFTALGNHTLAEVAELTRAFAARATIARGQAQLAAAAAPAAPFSPHAFLDNLAARGIAVSATPEGDLAVTGAEKLTAQDRHYLRTFKAGIVAALACDVEVL